MGLIYNLSYRAKQENKINSVTVRGMKLDEQKIIPEGINYKIFRS